MKTFGNLGGLLICITRIIVLIGALNYILLQGIFNILKYAELLIPLIIMSYDSSVTRYVFSFIFTLIMT